MADELVTDAMLDEMLCPRPEFVWSPTNPNGITGTPKQRRREAVRRRLEAIAPALYRAGQIAGLRAAKKMVGGISGGGVIYDAAGGQMDVVEPEWHYTERQDVEKAIDASIAALEAQK